MSLYWLDILLALLVTAHLLYQRRPTQTLIAWLLLVLLLPWVGTLIYVLFGSRKVFARRSKPPLQFHQPPRPEAPSPMARQMMRLLAHDGIPPAQRQHIEITLSPATARQWLFHAIEQARHSIWLETYIFAGDTTGLLLLEKLTEKARQGVEVRLLLDAFGSFGVYMRPGLFKDLRQAGGQVAFFQPLTSLFRSRINLRNHRKIYLFDQRTLLSGGINLAAEYLDSNHPAHWVDMTFRAHGPLVHTYAQTFAQDWYYTTGTTPSIIHPDRRLPGAILAQAVPSGPDVTADTIREVLLSAIAQAQHQIIITTPYFIPDEPVLEAVLLACKRGVHVCLLTPRETDHLLFDLGRAPYMRALHEAGADIRLYTPGMLHAKAVLIDRRLAMIGSANLDYRSLLINYELVTLIYSPKAIRQLYLMMHQLLPDTTAFRPPTSASAQFRENLTRIITPML